MNLKKENNGRSMIEMLGVLAIIGILSVSGLAGYGKAMEQFKINKVAEEYSMLIFGLLQNIDTIRQYETSDGSEYWLLDFAQAMDLIPNSWEPLNGKITEDSFGNKAHIFARSDRLVVDIYVNGGSSSGFSPRICAIFFNTLTKPLHSSLYYARLYRSSAGATSVFYGDKYCSSGRKCLSGISVTDIQNACTSCLEGNNCAIGMEF